MKNTIYHIYQKYRNKYLNCLGGAQPRFSMDNYRLGDQNTPEMDRVINNLDQAFLTRCRNAHPPHCLLSDLTQFYPGPPENSLESNYWKIISNVEDGQSFYHTLLRGIRSKGLTANLDRLGLQLSSNEYVNIVNLKTRVLEAVRSISEGGDYHHFIPREISEFLHVRHGPDLASKIAQMTSQLVKLETAIHQSHLKQPSDNINSLVKIARSQTYLSEVEFITAAVLLQICLARWNSWQSRWKLYHPIWGDGGPKFNYDPGMRPGEHQSSIPIPLQLDNPNLEIGCPNIIYMTVTRFGHCDTLLPIIK